MKNSNKNVFNLMSYVALIIIALLIVVDNFLPIIGVQFTGAIGTFMNILETIKNLFILIVIGVAAYNFIGDKAKWVKVVYWIAVVVFIVGAVLAWFI